MSVSMFGCREKQQIDEPVAFYYRRSELLFEGASGVIAAQQRESAGHESDTEYLLQEYLSGPTDPLFSQTFPTGSRMVSFKITDKEAQITLSDHFADLTGMDLTIACACITLTIIDLTGVENVTLSAQSAMLDNQSFITMDKSCLLLLDSNANS